MDRRALFVSALPLLAAAACRQAPAADPAARSIPTIVAAEDARGGSLVSPFASDPAPAVRARAALALGRIGDRAALPAVRALARDPDPAVAAAALFSWALLGCEGLDDPEVVAELRRAADPRVRSAAAFAFGFGGQEIQFAACADGFLADPDPKVRGDAALALAKFLDDRQQKKTPGWEARAAAAIEALGRGASQEKAADLRWRCAYALAATARPEAAAALRPCARDADPLVRLFAARGLGRGADPAPLVELARDPDARVACEAASGARNPRGKALFAAYVELLDRPETFVRRAALRAFLRGDASQQSELVAAAFEKGLRDPNPWVRGEALVAGAAAGAPAAAIRVAEGADDPAPAVRQRAAEAAAYLQAADALRVLEKLAADPNYLVAAAAARALARVADPKAKELLRAALAHGRGLVREDAAESIQAKAKTSSDLGEDVRALLESLRSARGEDMAEPRATLLAVLAEVETERRITNQKIVNPAEGDLRAHIQVALLDALSDPDPTVRAKAKNAWKRLLPEDAQPKVGVPPPPAPAIPGVTSPPFVRAPRVKVVTSRGAFVVELFFEEAPIHCENLLRLAEAGFYRGLPWHRVEFNFVVQGGDHLGDGTGARPAWGGTLRDELSPRPYLRGTLGMPKSDEPDSGGSQIFFSLIPTPRLDGRYTAFGQVVEGLEVLDAIEVGDTIEAIEVIDRGR